MSKRILRNPKPTEFDYCFVCGEPYSGRHEVFGGTRNRQKSIEDELQVKLCDFHHLRWENAPHVKPYKNDIATPDAWFDKQIKQDAQRKYEESHSREEFIKRYGRNYL